MTGALLLLLLAAAAADAAPDPALPQDDHSLAGQLLVAAPGMQDPRFRETVILMVRHGPEGAFGVVINRPVEERPLAELLASGGLSSDGVEGSIRIFYGGPVQPDVGFVLHDSDYDTRGTLPIDGHMAMTVNPAILQDIGHHHGPRQYLFALGYAGWAPGQLEAELARGDWSLAPADPHLVFEADRAALWELARSRRTKDI